MPWPRRLPDVLILFVWPVLPHRRGERPAFFQKDVNLGNLSRTGMVFFLNTCMKSICNISVLVLALLAGMVVMSCRKNGSVTVTVVADCTGTYLRAGGKDYKVCNPGKLSEFEPGQSVRVTFNTLADCTGPGGTAPVCFLYHPFESWVNVTVIR